MRKGTKGLGNHVARFFNMIEEAFRDYARAAGVSINELWAQFNDDPFAVRDAVTGLDWDDDVVAPFKKKYADGVRENYAPTMNRAAAEQGVAVAFGPSETSFYAENYIREHGATMLAQVNDNTKAAVRQIISDGIRGGLPPKQMARQIREQVGLLDSHVRAVESMRARLLSQGVPPSTVAKRSQKYADKLLRYRSYNIARTESLAALSQARVDGWRESVRQGYLPPSSKKQWVVTPDERLCPICSPLGMRAIPLDDTWELPSGRRVERPPAHPSCRCSVALVF